MMKKSVAALAALTMMASPVLAQAASPASALSVRAAAQEEGSELAGLTTGLVAPVIIAAIAVLVILGLTGTRPFDRPPPVSP